MGSRGFYQVVNVEEGKAAQHDQSYRSCIAALLIFFFLCIILILVSFPWKKDYFHQPEKGGESLEIVQHQHHYKHHTERTSGTTELTKHHSENDISLESTTSEIETFTENPVVIDVTSSNNTSSKFEKLLTSETFTVDELSTAIFNEKSYQSSFTIEVPLLQNVSFSTEDALSSTTEEYRRKDNKSEIYTTQSTASTDTDFVKEIVSFQEYETTTENIIQSTTEYEEGTTIDNTINITLSFDANETITKNSVKSTIRTEEMTILSTSAATNPFDAYESIPSNITRFLLEDKETPIIITTSDNPQYSTSDSATNTMEYMFTSSPTIMTTNNQPDNKSENEQICISGKCKNFASKMLFYMNHTTDPCEDFYEYACGSFEANPQVVERSAEDAAYQRISREMQKEMNDGKSSLFIKYYNSCMQYKNINLADRINLARRALDQVGKFYTIANWNTNHTSFTELIANLLLHNSAWLFNIAPDLDEYSPENFTLKIGPTTYRSLFDTEKTEDPCHVNRDETEKQEVDLMELYEEYRMCKENNTSEFIKSISEALSTLGVFNELNNTYNVSQYISFTVFNIDMEIVQNLLIKYPSRSKIHEAYLMKNYTPVSIAKLQNDSKVIDWRKLVYLLTNMKIQPDAVMQVYFYDVLKEALKNLENFEAKNAMNLNNAVLGLYAHDLYRELVLPKRRNDKEYCLRVATNILIPETSNLYISSFSNNERLFMNKIIHDLFEELKKTLKLNVITTWTEGKGRNALITKINDLKVTVPNVSYFTDNNSTYRQTGANEVVLTDNYFENSMILIRRYRRLMYKEFFKNPGDPEQIWTQYATPYQSKGLAIYGLNLVVIPFGVIDWSTIYNEFDSIRNTSFDYILLATLGTVIAHEIAHHFDANGIYYWNGIRDINNSLFDDDFTSEDFQNYIHCQRDFHDKNSASMKLPFTGQTVFYKITQLTLNERLSETMGLRLAYDTLVRLRSRAEVYLPWLEPDFKKLFYLTYAQMHCTKLPLTSSYVSLYEDEQLPSRIRIFISASTSSTLSSAWSCPDGSSINPSSSCSVFPYL